MQASVHALLKTGNDLSVTFFSEWPGCVALCCLSDSLVRHLRGHSLPPALLLLTTCGLSCLPYRPPHAENIKQAFEKCRKYVAKREYKPRAKAAKADKALDLQAGARKAVEETTKCELGMACG